MEPSLAASLRGTTATPRTLSSVPSRGASTTSVRISALDRAIPQVTSNARLSATDKDHILHTLNGDRAAMVPLAAGIAADHASDRCHEGRSRPPDLDRPAAPLGGIGLHALGNSRTVHFQSRDPGSHSRPREDRDGRSDEGAGGCLVGEVSAPVMLSRWAVPAAGLVLIFGLTACGTRTAPSAKQTPTASAMPATAPSTDPLADIDRQLATVDGAAAQSTSDLTAGDTSASVSDDGQ